MLGLFATLLSLILGLFYLPYRVPVAPSVSDSYVFNYNNRLGFLLALAGAALLLQFGPPISLSAEDGKALSRKTLYKALMPRLSPAQPSTSLSASSAASPSPST